MPWLGFFDKAAQADRLVLLDVVAFTKNGYQNRTRIKGPSGPQWLTVPVMTAGRFAQPTNEVLIDSRSEWSRKHIAALTTNYGRSPHFAVVRETVFPILETRPDALATLNERLIRALAGMFGLRCEI